MTLPLPVVDEDVDDKHLYTRGPVTPHWAQRVKRHQRHLMRRLRGGNDQNIPARRINVLPLPWTIDDLRHTPGRAMDYSTAYRGVAKRRWHPGYAAFVPPGYGIGRRKVGSIYPTPEDAAQAVLGALNPNASTPAKETTL